MTEKRSVIPLENERRRNQRRSKERKMPDLHNVHAPIEAEMESVGGEPLDGSGFETEEAEPDFDYRQGIKE